MQHIIDQILKESIKVKEQFITENQNHIILLAKKVAEAFTNDRKLMICGNGGSAADAQHIVAEFVNRFEMERPPLPALALTTDTSIITSVGNDSSFEDIFSKQIKALGVPGDILLAISTSGQSKNILKAVKAAQKIGIYTVAFTGKDGGELAKLANLSIVVKSSVTARIQEAHILAGHLLCHLVDYVLFKQHIEEAE